MPNQVFSTAQQLAADSLISLYQLDATALGGSVYFFTPGTLQGPVMPQLITNACCPTTTSGWASHAGAGGNSATLGAAANVAPAYALEGYGSGYAFCAAITSGPWSDVGWRPGGSRVSVTPGLTYEFQGLVAPGRCRVLAMIVWYNAASTFIGQVGGDFAENPDTPERARTLEDYTRISVRGVAPANAAFCTPLFRMLGVGGLPNTATNAMLAWSQALFGAVPADSLRPVPWAPFKPFGKPAFQGIIYEPVPMEAEGFEWTGRGPVPRPRLRISNIGNLAGQLAIGYGDLLGAKLTRIRTFEKYLDGMPTADPGSYFEPDIWYFDRKVTHAPDHIEWELASVLDQEGRRLPGRQMLRDVCTHTYRTYKDGFNYTGVTCPYTGGSYFDVTGTPTGDPAKDVCGRRLSDCQLRFPDQALPTRAFPGMALDPR